MAARRVVVERPVRIPFVKQTTTHQPSTEQKANPPSPSYREGGGFALSVASAGTEAKPDELLAAANKLTDADRKWLLDQLALRQHQESAPTAADRDLNHWSEAAYDALLAALGGPGGAEWGPAVVKRTVGARSAWLPVRDFLAAAGLEKCTVQERIVALRLLAQLVVRRASRIAARTGAPLGPKLFASCCGSIRGIFDASFPGYLASGMAMIVLRQAALVAKDPERYAWDRED